MKKNVGSQLIGVQMVSATDGSDFTGTVTVYVTGDGGTQALGGTASGVCTHEGKGYHTYVPTQAETDYGLIAFTYQGTGAITTTVQVFTTFPQTADHTAGIAAIPTTMVGTDNALLAASAPTNWSSMGIEADGDVHADVKQWLGAAAATPTQAGVPEVDVTFVAGVAVSGTPPDVNVAQISGDATAADNLELDYDGTGLTRANSTIGTVTTNTDMRGTDNALLASTFSTMFNGITALAEWLGLIAGKQAADATALTEIKATGAGSGTYSETTDSLEAIRDTAPMGSTMVGTDNAALASVLGSPSGADIAADIAENQTDLDLVLSTGSTGPWTSGGAASDNYEVKGSYMLTGSTLNYVYWVEKNGQRVGTISAPSIDITDKDAVSVSFTSTPSIVGTNMAKGSGTFAVTDNVPYTVVAKATYATVEYTGVLPAGGYGGMTILRGGISIIKHTPSASAGFTIPVPPTTSAETKVALAPEFTAGPTGLDPYRPWSVVVLDGLTYLANGFDQPKRWDGSSTFYNIGSTAPTSFNVALTVGVGSFANGITHTYYLVFRDSTTGKETAPQQTSGVPGITLENDSGGARDFRITWTDPASQYDTARVYRQLQNSDGVKFLVDVNIADETYDDIEAEAALAINDPYVDTFRATLPPKFDWLRAYQGRLFGGFRDSATVYYAQAVRIDDDYRAEDFPDGWILQPGSEDGSGGVITMLPHYASAYFFKRRACFELAGDLAEGTHSIRKMSADRGCISEDCIVELDGSALILDERGLYWWTPAGEPLVAGAVTGTRESPIQSTWDRMNLGVAHKFFMVHDREDRIVRVFVALDFEPVPNVAAVFDYGENRFVSIDTLCHGMAAGEFRDATDSALHMVRTDDMGYAWEDEYAQSQGVFAGENTATLTAATQLALTDSAATFDTTTTDGAPGAPYERYDTDGTVLDQNRVAAASSTVITPFLFSTDTPAVDDTIAIGVIPAIARIPRITLNTTDKKWVRCVTVDHDNGVNGSLRVDTARDEEAMALAREFSLLTLIHTPCKVSDRGWTWTVQFSQRYANLGFSVRGLHIDYVSVPGQRK